MVTVAGFEETPFETALYRNVDTPLKLVGNVMVNQPVVKKLKLLNIVGLVRNSADPGLTGGV